MDIALFPGCLVDMMYPEVGMAAVHVLERLGCHITLPQDQVCCGQPLTNSGFGEKAKPMMTNVLNAYADYPVIVSLSGSCTYQLKDECARYFQDDPEMRTKQQAVASHIYEFSQFIVDVLGVTDVGAELNASFTYHASCHLTRMLGVKTEPLELLSHVHGLRYIEMQAPARCCGFGGTFSVKEPDISSQMVHEKAEHVLATEADYLVGADQACLLNIEGALEHMYETGQTKRQIKVRNLAQILDNVPKGKRFYMPSKSNAVPNDAAVGNAPTNDATLDNAPAFASSQTSADAKEAN